MASSLGPRPEKTTLAGDLGRRYRGGPSQMWCPDGVETRPATVLKEVDHLAGPAASGVRPISNADPREHLIRSSRQTARARPALLLAVGQWSSVVDAVGNARGSRADT